MFSVHHSPFTIEAAAATATSTTTTTTIIIHTPDSHGMRKKCFQPRYNTQTSTVTHTMTTKACSQILLQTEFREFGRKVGIFWDSKTLAICAHDFRSTLAKYVEEKVMR